MLTRLTTGTMAQGNNSNFLSIPSQEGLFKTVRVERCEDNGNDEDEEETEEDVRLIPRSSPVPRKRGSSIADETAEYMRIRLALPNRRVSFADSTGAELVDVRMFVPFDSDEEDDSRWEEEEARYQKAYREPTYRVWPEFEAPTGTELVLAVHTNKLEVESVTSVPDEPLTFEVIIRVLNISFHKSVYARSTMDGWINHFDYPAEYVLGSNDGETDKFSVKLSFASPYLFNGARIDFVVRYETSEGEFWANNSGRNYSVTLIQSYEEEETAAQSTADKPEPRGILKPPRYRAGIDYDDSDDRGDDLSSTECEAAENRASFAKLVIVQPEIDIETAKNLSSSPESTRTSSSAGCSLSTSDTPFGELLPLESISFNMSPQIEKSGLHLSIVTVPHLQPTQQFSEAQNQVYIVPSSVSLSLPKVFVQLCEGPESTKDEFEDFTEPDQPLHPQKDVEAQVPFEFGQPSLAGIPDTPHIQEEGMKDFKEKQNVEMADILEEPNHTMEENKTETCTMEETEQPPSSEEVLNDATEGLEIFSSEALENTLEEIVHEQKEELVFSLGYETVEVVEVESTKMDDQETHGLESSYLSLLHLDCTTQEGETQSLLVHLTTQEEGLVSDSNVSASVIPEVFICTPEDLTENPELVSVSEATPTAFDLQPSTVSSLAEDNLTFEADEHSLAPHQTSKDIETQHTLPEDAHELSQISKDHAEVRLDKCLMVSTTFFSAVICLVVGIQEPSAFLCLVIFLLSLWF